MSNSDRKSTVKVMLFGTFDGLHKGHLNFFKQARALAPKKAFLVASVARDSNVLRIKNRRPYLKEKDRMKLLENCKLVDKVVLSGVKNYISHIKKESPDFIALGYDQVAYVKDLKKDLKEVGLGTKVVRMKPYKENIYKNYLLYIAKANGDKHSSK